MARRVVGGGRLGGALLALGFKASLVLLMVATPLLGVWVASSLAAYGRTPVWVPLVVGALLFPVGPVLWELVAQRRRRTADARARARGREPRGPILTTGDRLIFRALAVNLLFLGLLLWSRPELAFIALSTRGDWMLDGRTGASVEQTRRGLFAAAQGLEWLYRLSHTNPFREPTPSPSSSVSPSPAPSPQATLAPTRPTPTEAPTGSVAPAAGSAGGAPAVPSAAPSVASTAWPMAGGVHPLVASMPPEIEGNITAMGAYLQRRLPDEIERIRAVHDYVADRISYDGPSYLAKRYPPQDAASVLKARKGVCAGYADLFQELGRAAGLDVVYVVGDTRRQDGSISGEGHAWNAVRAGQRWYLVDTTWDSGHLKGAEFVKNFRTDYLLTPAEIMTYTHLPEDARWQLRERPLSRGEFLRQPMLSPAFFADGLVLESPDRSQVDVQGSLTMRVRNARQRFLLASYAPAGVAGATGKRCEVKGRETVQVDCAFAERGTFDVSLFANAEEYGTFHYVGRIQVNAR